MRYDKTAGQVVREAREKKGISLRQFAGRIGKTPTFVSRFERDDDISPSEETLQTMARVLEIDADDLIFRARKMPADVSRIVQKEPVGMMALLRSAQNLSAEELKDLTENIQNKTKRKE
jgi:transcriptional regulator with XRE-family HTH domain